MIYIWAAAARRCDVVRATEGATSTACYVPVAASLESGFAGPFFSLSLVLLSLIVITVSAKAHNATENIKSVAVIHRVSKQEDSRSRIPDAKSPLIQDLHSIRYLDIEGTNLDIKCSFGISPILTEAVGSENKPQSSHL